MKARREEISEKRRSAQGEKDKNVVFSDLGRYGRPRCPDTNPYTLRTHW